MRLQFKSLRPENLSPKVLWVGWVTVCLGLAIAAQPALAHHPTGGRTPGNVLEGFLSGLAHPVIGFDHLAFVVAIGLLAALQQKPGLLIPVAFVLSTLAGTGIHLGQLDLPVPEVVIAASVLGFGVLLAGKDSPTLSGLILPTVVAGVFHGYAYGKAIVGAQMTPLMAYLTGFAVIQLVVALAAFSIGRSAIAQLTDESPLPFRFAGYAIGGIGAAFLSSAIVG